MSENYRRDVTDYTQWCDPKRKGPKQRVYRPHSMRQVDASNELNRLNTKLRQIQEYIDSERFNTKRIGIGNVLHTVFDEVEGML